MSPRLFAAAAVALLLTAPLRADLADLETGVEAVEKDEGAGSPAPADTEDGGDNLFGDLLIELFRILWATNNLSTTYGDHPYPDDGPFVRLGTWKPDPDTGDLGVYPLRGRDWWYTAEAQGFVLEGLGAGTWFSIQGNAFRFFGPYAEVWNLTDGSQIQGGVRAGANVSLLQTEVLSLAVYTQANFWYGTVNRSGGSVGLEARAYPLKPLSLGGRWGAQLFRKFSVSEAEALAGWVLGTVEVAAGWRWWQLRNLAGDPGAGWGGPFLGTKFWL